MKCCSKCFSDKYLIDFIEAEGAIGNCDFCKSEDVKTMPAEDLGNNFEELLSLYERDEGHSTSFDRSLARQISGWKVFSEKLDEEAQNSILDEIRLGPLGPKEQSITARSNDSWRFKYAYWEDGIWERFSDHIKHSRRFIMGDGTQFTFPDPREWLPSVLIKTEWSVGSELTFYRARQGFAKDGSLIVPRPAEEMGAPPGETARRGGRANPAGISYLYVAEELETAVAEVRPYVGAYVSVCAMKAKKALKVADITQIHSIESAFNQPNLHEKVQNNAMLNMLNRELARPIKPDDTEIEYVPTQYLAEAILDIGYDGIRYRSAVRDGGRNVVFFNPQQMNIELRTRLVEVRSIDVKFDEIFVDIPTKLRDHNSGTF